RSHVIPLQFVIYLTDHHSFISRPFTLHDHRDLLGHVHIADNHRYQPGSGTLDFHALFEQLRADNYQGYVVYEGRIRAEAPAQAYRDSLAWLRTC
ncbi:TIM barrel protein, partial [Escherichia coli]|uniref:TIM barrel protein n=1 Tax=Escherichia coli TaxID=562 RepID=UPI002FE3DB2D